MVKLYNAVVTGCNYLHRWGSVCQNHEVRLLEHTSFDSSTHTETAHIPYLSGDHYRQARNVVRFILFKQK